MKSLILSGVFLFFSLLSVILRGQTMTGQNVMPMEM